MYIFVAQEKDKLVGEVIRYILFKTEQNSGCPIKREDLTQLITGKGYKQRNLPAFVIKEAKSKLSSIFGYEMREIQRARPSVTVNQGRVSQSHQCESFIRLFLVFCSISGEYANLQVCLFGADDAIQHCVMLFIYLFSFLLY